VVKLLEGGRPWFSSLLVLGSLASGFAAAGMGLACSRIFFRPRR